MQDTFARATQPVGQARRATIGYLIYKAWRLHRPRARASKVILCTKLLYARKLQITVSQNDFGNIFEKNHEW